ncbi:DUF305 domain-containing protein [Actinoplanes sp. NPDC049596]|uniref:DUF305 domain-containing protein n=1 Tax=unclassified Actinoplanes TaxID=2626549 RepID=UPI003442E958
MTVPAAGLRKVAYGLVLLLVATGAYLLGVRPAPPPADDSVAVGFARDMAAHHQQAVDMSLTVLGRDPSPEVATLAYDIAGSQAVQQGMLLGWLAAWGRSPSGDRPPMAWMGMPPPNVTDLGRGIRMPGMADRAELAGLRRSSGREADIRFLRLMIRHHLGGIHMAEAALAGPLPVEERRLAVSIMSAQQAEVTTMSALLADRTGAPGTR